MVKFGKWLGGGLGWALGGPIGGLLGFALGSLFDTANITTFQDTETVGRRFDSGSKQTRPGDFHVSLLVLTAAVMKADGRVLKTEVSYVREFLVKQFGKELAGQMLLMLREILKQDFDVYEVSSQIRHFMDHPSRLQLLHYLFELCISDSDFNEVENEVVTRIAIYLGISNKDIESIKAIVAPKKSIDNYYKILEIDPSAGIDEIKRAYRKMAVKYHPDKVSHLGEAAQKAANEKFKQVQEAYEYIKKERGFN